MMRASAPGLSFCIVLAACAPRLELPPGLDDATPHPVTGRAAERFTSDEVRFGPYAAFSISRGFNSSFAERMFFGASIDELKEYPEDTSFSFAFKNEQARGHEWRAACTTAPLRRGVADEAPMKQLACTCVGESASDTVTIEMASESDDLRGQLRLGDKAYAVAGSRDAAGENKKRSGATGYIVSQGDRPLAAIDVLEEGTVWLVPGVKGIEQDAVACVGLALLLHH